VSYRSRVDAAFLTGTPPLRALWWALSFGRIKRSPLPARYAVARAHPRQAA
jgi:hypothetical protein